MSNKKIDDRSQIEEEIKEKTTSLKGGRFLDPDYYRDWFEKENHKPICGVQVMNYMHLSREKAKKFLNEYTSIMFSLFKEVHESSSEKKFFSKKSINNALSDILADWSRNKKVVMYNSENQFSFYLYVLVRGEIERKEIDTHFEESEKGEMENLEEIERGVMKKAPIILWKTEGEDKNIELIDRIRLLESLDQEERSVMKLHYEGYSEREITKKVGKPKTTIHDLISRFK